MRLIPFQTRFNWDGNLVCEFSYRATSKKDGHYIVELIWDYLELTVTKSTCDCIDCQVKRKEDNYYECKHILDAKRVIKEYPEELE
jgi:hypothetical protein